MRFIPRWETCALIPVGQIIILSGGVLCGMLEAWLAHRRSKTLRQRQRAARRIAPADLLLLQQEAAAAANRNCWEATKQRFYGRLDVIRGRLLRPLRGAPCATPPWLAVPPATFCDSSLILCDPLRSLWDPL